MPAAKMAGAFRPRNMPREGSLEAGLIAAVGLLLATLARLKPNRALFTIAVLKTWLHSRAAILRLALDTICTLLKASRLGSGELSNVYVSNMLFLSLIF